MAYLIYNEVNFSSVVKSQRKRSINSLYFAGFLKRFKGFTNCMLLVIALLCFVFTFASFCVLSAFNGWAIVYSVVRRVWFCYSAGLVLTVHLPSSANICKSSYLPSPITLSISSFWVLRPTRQATLAFDTFLLQSCASVYKVSAFRSFHFYCVLRSLHRALSVVW